MVRFLRKSFKSEGREALCLPNLLAGGLPADALSGLALACAADKRAQHTRATQKSTTHARHTKEHNTHAWIYTGDITAAIEMGGRPLRISIAAVISPVYVHACVLCSFVWRACVVLFCVARVCCALFVGCKPQTCRQAPSQEIRQA